MLRYLNNALSCAFLVMASVTALKVSVPKLNFGFGVKNNHAISVTMQEIQVDLKKSLLSLAILPLLLASTSSVAHADEAKDVQKYYWGVGCFWHAQHEFINAEKQVLGRSDDQLVSMRASVVTSAWV